METSIGTYWKTMETSITRNNRGMVNDMGGAVGGDMLLDRDLGNMVDLVVDLISNLMDNRGSGNSNRGSMSKSNWCSMGNSKRSSINGRSRSINASSQTMSEKTMSKETMSIDTTSKNLSISISSGGSKATGNKG